MQLSTQLRTVSIAVNFLSSLSSSTSLALMYVRASVSKLFIHSSLSYSHPFQRVARNTRRQIRDIADNYWLWRANKFSLALCILIESQL